MYLIIKGQAHETSCSVPVNLVTRENVDSFGTDGWQ